MFLDEKSIAVNDEYSVIQMMHYSQTEKFRFKETNFLGAGFLPEKGDYIESP